MNKGLLPENVKLHVLYYDVMYVRCNHARSHKSAVPAVEWGGDNHASVQYRGNGPRVRAS